MLAVTKDQPFDSDEHLFEPKWDGIRCLAICDGGLHLYSRNRKEITQQFPEFLNIQFAKDNCVLDGEIICLDENNRPNFDAVRRRLAIKNKISMNMVKNNNSAVYMVFDILEYKNEALLSFSLQDRKSKLSSVILENAFIRNSPVVYHRGKTLYETMLIKKMEGIMAKDISSRYEPGTRSSSWIKIRCTKREIFYVLGYTINARHTLRSIAVGELSYNNRFKYLGLVGTGLSDKLRFTLHKKLSELKIKESGPANTEEQIIWVQPRLKCSVEYLEKSHKGILRHAVFKSLLQKESGIDEN